MLEKLEKKKSTMHGKRTHQKFISATAIFK